MKLQILILLLFCGTFGLCESNAISNDSVACENNFLELNLNKSGIKYFKKLFIKSTQITRLNLQYNDIENIENGAFDGLTNLRHLNLTGNKLSQSYFSTMENPTIETLVLDEAFNIPETKILKTSADERQHYFGGWQLSRDYYTYTTTMRPDAEYYYIRNINISLPMKFQRLKALHLCRNNISRIIIHHDAAVDSFGYISEVPKNQLPDITHLYLSKNQIENVSFLNDMSPTLKHLDLQNNQISKFSIQPEIILTIEELLLDNNYIAGLCSDYYDCDHIDSNLNLKDATNLRKLSLSHNQITIVESGAMNDLTSLVELDLSYNLIDHSKSINEIAKLNNLELLKLQNNRLKSMPDFCELKKLEKLLLDDNMIERIDGEFSCLSNLENISLRNNKINVVKSGAFDTLLLLLELDLSGNRLNILPDNWISTPRNLRSLHLNSNLFTSIASMSLNNLTDTLKTMNIAGNPLRFFTLKSLNSLPENTIFEIDNFSQKIVG